MNNFDENLKMAETVNNNAPAEWENKIQAARNGGVLMIVGKPDVGKTTFARYLFSSICEIFPKTAYLDGDPGQSMLGPPASMTLALSKGKVFPPTGRLWRIFTGSVSPARDMLTALISAARLIDAAQKAGTRAIVYDTCGFVDASSGGVLLKQAKIDLLRPTVLFALQQEREIEPLLAPLRRSRRLKVVDIPLSPAIKRRDMLTRRSYRAEKFASYFKDASCLKINWTKFAVFPVPYFRLHQLVAMEDTEGFAVGMGIVEDLDPRNRHVTLYTPLSSTENIDSIRVGKIMVDPRSFEDRPV